MSSGRAAALNSLSCPAASSSLAALPSQLWGWVEREKDALVGVVGPLGRRDRSILALGPEGWVVSDL
jgi:hypothetical protein